MLQTIRRLLIRPGRFRLERELPGGIRTHDICAPWQGTQWNLIEKRFHPEFMSQLETMLALGNGYLGMRGCPEEGGPYAENSTLINGFYETRPIVYGEEAYGFPKTGQTILNVTDSKTIRLFVDDEPFWLPSANLLSYDRRLNMKSGTLHPRGRVGDTCRETSTDHIAAFGLLHRQARGRHFLSRDTA